jgi:hypothetical protein
MSSTDSSSEVIESSKRGYALVSRARREELLGEFERSGMSAPNFAKLVGIKYPTFMGWIYQRRGKQVQHPSQSSVPAKGESGLWFEAVIEKAQAAIPPGTAQPLLVRLPSGAALEVGHSSQVQLGAALLRAWEKAAC